MGGLIHKLSLGIPTSVVALLAMAQPTRASALRQMPRLEPVARRALAAEEASERRVAHAKELLGKYYRRSVVAIDPIVEEMRAFRGFIQERVADAFKGRDRKYSSPVYKTILAESKKHGFDPIFLMAVIENESSFKPKIRGRDGEIGLMQILPSTGKWVAEKNGLRWKGKRTLEDPVMNIRIGAAYLAHLRERFDSHGRLYLAAYNMGSTNVNRALARDIWPKEYPARVMQRYVRFYRELVAEQN